MPNQQLIISVYSLIELAVRGHFDKSELFAALYFFQGSRRDDVFVNEKENVLNSHIVQKINQLKRRVKEERFDPVEGAELLVSGALIEQEKVQKVSWGTGSETDIQKLIRLNQFLEMNNWNSVPLEKLSHSVHKNENVYRLFQRLVKEANPELEVVIPFI